MTQGHGARAGHVAAAPPEAVAAPRPPEHAVEAVPIGAGEPVEAAACLVLRERLRRVERQLRCLEPSDESGRLDPQDVHRLRVAVRRADAGMSAFRDVFAHGPWKRTRRALRAIRRAAGAVRQFDVHLAMLRHERDDAYAPLSASVECLTRSLRKARSAAVRRLDRELGSITPRRLRTLRRRLLAPESIASVTDAPTTLAELSRRVGAELSQRLAASNIEASAGVNGLHRVRLLCKRVRYSIEVFAPCLDRLAIADASDALTRMQDRLGAINDLHELVACIDALAPQVGPPPVIARGAAARARAPIDLSPARQLFSQRLEGALQEFFAWAGSGGWSQFVSAASAAFGPRPLSDAPDASPLPSQAVEPRLHASPSAAPPLQPLPAPADVPAVIVTQSARAIPTPARGRAQGRDTREDARGGVRA